MKIIEQDIEPLRNVRLYGWESDDPLTPFAPSFKYYILEKKIFSKEECEDWYEFLLDQEAIILSKHTISAGDGYTGVGTTSVTSRFPYFNTLQFDFGHVPKLIEEIIDCIKIFLSITNNKDFSSTLYANSWFNVLRMGETFKTHFHGYHKNSFLNFHLTIGAKETFTSYYHPVTYIQEEKDAFHIPNKPGYLTLFPDFVPHGVSVNNYPEPRISIAGGIFPETWMDDPSRNMSKSNYIELGTPFGTE